MDIYKSIIFLQQYAPYNCQSYSLQSSIGALVGYAFAFCFCPKDRSWPFLIHPDKIFNARPPSRREYPRQRPRKPPMLERTERGVWILVLSATSTVGSNMIFSPDHNFSTLNNTIILGITWSMQHKWQYQRAKIFTWFFLIVHWVWCRVADIQKTHRYQSDL